MSRSRDPRTVVGGVLATVGLLFACVATTQGPALAGMRWDGSGHRTSAVVAGGQRLTTAAPVVSELSR